MVKRSTEEVSAEIEMIKAELKATPKDSPNVGHLLTILIGLEGELRDMVNLERARSSPKCRSHPKIW